MCGLFSVSGGAKAGAPPCVFQSYLDCPDGFDLLLAMIRPDATILGMIPQRIVGLLSRIIPDFETHDSMNSLFLYAGAPAEIPEGSKGVKAQSWLLGCNTDGSVDEMAVLGAILEHYLEEDIQPGDFREDEKNERNRRIQNALSACGLQYYRGGTVSAHGSPSSRTLSELVRRLDVQSISYEFNRAIENVARDPYEAVSASCNILESIMRVYIEELNLGMPNKQDIGGLWNVSKKGLNFDPTSIEDIDLLKILSGMNSIVDGLGSLRTHASSAHGRGKFRYVLQSRHVTLAVNAAHTLSNFILETWANQRESGATPQ